MLTDPIATADLVHREVRSGERDGEPTRLVVARRTYATDQVDLWDAVTNPERLPRWFLPVTGELHVGGRYQLEGNAGGTVERCDERERFAVTWEFAEQVSWVTVTLSPADDGTTLEVAHEAPVDPAFWAQYGPGATGVGWELGLVGLGLHLETDAPVDPEEALSWPTTSEGIAFVRHVAAGWARAAVADGDDAAAARDAAENTVGFYTVGPEA
jgi:uncharacterized protein YndB with AHSA1/START domain